MLEVLALCLALAAPGQDTLNVSSRTGNDADADGTLARPYRSLTAAIKATSPASATEIRVDLGTYDVAGGESFPLQLRAGLRITGLGSSLTTIDGGGAAVVAQASGAPGRLILSGLSLVGGAKGLLLSSPAAAEKLDVALRDVGLRQAEIGLAVELSLQPGAGPLALAVDGLRAVGCGRGLAVWGSGPLVLRIDASAFEDCDIGLFLEADPDEDGSQIGQDDAPQYLRVQHDLAVRRTGFVGCRTAGVRRQGADGKNTGPAYVFEDCTFQKNDIGLELQRPCADTGFNLRRCEFLENTRFGLRVTGRVGDPQTFNRIEDSLFRWNGVGLHTASTNLELRRDRIVENTGNGIFSSNFLADPTTTFISDSLIANNGAGGFYGLADARLLTVKLVHSTIVFNAQVGVRNHTRHHGTSHYELRGCIVTGNAKDLSGLEPESVFDSWIGEDVGAPGFVAPELRDYRLRADSPCLDRGSDQGDSGAGELDLAGNPRRNGRPDLGAFELQ